jgi:hypothetical protein
MNELIRTYRTLDPTVDQAAAGAKAPETKYTIEGKVAYADGSGWDPGEGAGLYVYGTAWKRLQRREEFINDKAALPGYVVHDSGILGAAADNYNITGLNLAAAGVGAYQFLWSIECPAGSYATPVMYIDNGSGGYETTHANYACHGQYNGYSAGSMNSAAYPGLCVVGSSSAYTSELRGEIILQRSGAGKIYWHVRTSQSLFNGGVLQLSYATSMTNFYHAATKTAVTQVQFKVLYNANPPVTLLTNGIGANSRFIVRRLT